MISAVDQNVECKVIVPTDETNPKINVNQQLFKSPSDTMIYSPVLRKMNNDDISLIEKISNFVESIRLDNGMKRGNGTPEVNKEKTTEVDRSADRHTQTRGDVRQVESSKRSKSPQVHCSKSSQMRSDRRKEPNSDERNKVSDHLILQAEKFKARVEAPRGNYSEILMPYDYDKLKSRFVTQQGLVPIDNEIMFLRNFDQDDEFFHITSQIDPNLRQKIERGEFIELERLLPKDRFGGKNDDLNKQLFQLITQGTNSYLEPPQAQHGKINSIRKWDQAFRVYAAIYMHANPERSSEIWQYIYVIHTAASSNPWDNVYYYDFRELMASKPWRSWGKTYTQGWNMAFNNSHVLNGGSGSYSGNYSTANSSNNAAGFSSRNNAGTKSWKDDCCWRFNKNRCTKSGTECRYDHRCTYCGGWGNGFYNCRKRNNRQQQSQKRNSNNGTLGQNKSPKNEK